MNPALVAALAAGATVVTPNKRLARHVVDAFDRAQREAGRRAWTAAKAVPWPAWVGALEDEATAAGAISPRVRLGPAASALLWRAALDGDGAELRDVAGLAALAAEAWDLVHAWGAGGESWRSWAGGEGESAAFARWAERYRVALAGANATDHALAPDRVAASASRWTGHRFVFVGFVELTSQQRRLAQALANRGATVEERPVTDLAPATARRATFATADDEIAGALAWARAACERDPQSKIGVVVPDLAQRLDRVRLRAIDILGVPESASTATQAWNISLGAPIDAVPLVATAIDLIALAWTSLPIGRAAALLRSAHLPDADGPSRWSRARIERDWLEAGIADVRLRDAHGALDGHDRLLAQRFAAMRAVAERTRRATRHGWVDAWRAALAAAGWPGHRVLASDEHQAARAFDEHLATFAALDAVGREELAAEAAIGAFASILATSPFQPKRPSAPIQILGLYEAIGLPFDALWVAGMNDETLPRAPRPHPLLPVRWQREHGVPRSDAVRELAYAREVADWLLRAAPQVVVSHAATIDDRPAAPSAVFPAGEPVRVPDGRTPARVIHEARPRRERIRDERAPTLAAGERVKGGAGLVQAQSDCPFQALAANRWRTDPWPAPLVGLSPLERGQLVHAALAAFWAGLAGHDALQHLIADPERFIERCHASARVAIASVDTGRWRRVPALVRALEEGRLAALLEAWLVEVERDRPPFRIEALEAQAKLALGPLDLSLRLDRIDRLDDGGVAIIDYKTGIAAPIVHWWGERPRAVQLALYTLAWRDRQPDVPVRAAVLGQMRRGNLRAAGLYADEAARFSPRPARKERTDPVVDWPAREADWARTMRALADRFADGDAPVAPRESALCRTCARQALCRIDDAALADEDAPDTDEAGEGTA